MGGTLYSIGHGNKEIEQFIEELRSFGIRYLADVRSKPYSKWNAEFNQAPLRAHLSEAGIVYVYMGDVIGGRPEDPSCYTNGHIDYSKMAKKESFVKGLERLITANDKQIKLAVMCSESEPSMCHRSKLIGQELLKRGISMIHIVGIGKSKSQERIITELNGGYGLVDLFGDEKVLMSRNKYQ